MRCPPNSTKARNPVITGLAERGLTMLVVTHEMRFARDASTRVFYMDKGEVWEEGTPEQIFEHPARQETHDFVFRVRSWEWDVETTSPDVPAMEASLLAYCRLQFMGRRAANACCLIVEEAVANQAVEAARSRDISNPRLHVTLTAGEGGVDTVLRVDWHEAFPPDADPFAEGADEISRGIVRRLCKRIETIAPGVTEFVVGK